MAEGSPTPPVVASTTETAKPSNQELVAELRRCEDWYGFSGLSGRVEALLAERDALSGKGVNAQFSIWATNFARVKKERDALEGRVAVLEAALRDDPSKWSFDALVTIAQLILDADYPADIFTGVSGDPGPVFVACLRDALAALPDARSGAVLAGGDAATCEKCGGLLSGAEFCPDGNCIAGGDAAPQTDNLGGDEVASSGGES